jgi:gp16 family phage-associated protein
MKTPQQATKTPDQVKANFLAAGITMSEWARAQGFTPRDVSLVLNGQIKGRYGKGHKIAVALGIKTTDQHAAA